MRNAFDLNKTLKSKGRVLHLKNFPGLNFAYGSGTCRGKFMTIVFFPNKINTRHYRFSQISIRFEITGFSLFSSIHQFVLNRLKKAFRWRKMLKRTKNRIHRPRLSAILARRSLRQLRLREEVGSLTKCHDNFYICILKYHVSSTNVLFFFGTALLSWRSKIAVSTFFLGHFDG